MAFFTPWKLSSQKLGFFLVTFGFIWGMMLLHFTIQQRTQPESSSMLREQILDLSKRYIKALAEENRNVVDGPYAGVMTAYDRVLENPSCSPPMITEYLSGLGSQWMAFVKSCSGSSGN
ncbi:hypothetical protein FD754_009954 [Muntiacus muntjak]|uniref:MGT5A-like N-terminal domain-containing protein n=1 Tax=Muntiacus muntjak TaxID=9888 RepID=A0A5N3WY49_MUNMU|nr:hypothetical protein FD754_009954 [Muntiacus muntjak]